MKTRDASEGIEASQMTEVKAFVRPERVEDVVRALEEVGVCHLTIVDVRALGKGVDPSAYRYSIEFVERYSDLVKLEIVCPHISWRQAVDLIVERAHTGDPGDGFVFVTNIHHARDIRTGEAMKASGGHA